MSKLGCASSVTKTELVISKSTKHGGPVLPTACTVKHPYSSYIKAPPTMLPPEIVYVALARTSLDNPKNNSDKVTSPF